MLSLQEGWLDTFGDHMAYIVANDAATEFSRCLVVITTCVGYVSHMHCASSKSLDSAIPF